MCLHITSSLSLSNHPWISQNENCILVNSSLPLIRACWHPLILPFWSPQHKYGFPSKHLTSFVTEYLLVLWGVSLPQGGSIYHYSILTGGSLYHGGQNTISHRPLRPHECLAGSGSTNHDCADRMSGQFLFYHEHEAIFNDKSRDDHDDEPPCWNALAGNAIVMMKASIDTVSEQ